MTRCLATLRSLALAAGLFASHAAFAAQPADAQACINNLFSGIRYSSTGCGASTARPIKIARLLKNNGFASYMEGYVIKTSSAGTTLRATGNMLYSDRTVGDQPFDWTDGDSFRVTIANTGTVTMENLRWGTTSAFTATCASNTIMLSNSSVMYLITYGAVTNEACGPD